MNAARLLKFISFFLAVTLLVACAGPAAEKLPALKVAYTNWWGDYTMIIAREKGFFTKYGVDVEPVYYDVFSKALPDLASSEIDGGAITLGDTISVSNYTSLTAVALCDDGGASVIVSKPEIASPADLKGKRIGIIPGSSYEIIVTEMLGTVNLQQKDVTLVNLDPENVTQGLRDNKIDAGFTWEPYTSEAIAAGNRVLFSGDQIAGFFSNAIVFRTAVVTQRPEDIKNYLSAWFDAVNFRIENPDEANHIIAFTLNIPIDTVNGDARLFNLSDNLNLFSDTPTGNAKSVYALAQLNKDFLVSSGSLTTIPDLAQLFTPFYLLNDGKE